MWNPLRRGGWLAAIAVITGLATLAAAGPAHADHNNSGAFGTSFVDGTGTVSDDFGEHFDELGHSLCYGCPNSWNTDLVVMWQAILAAHIKLDVEDIDGRFGPQTRDATKSWQRELGITADGVVGPVSWRTADNRLNLSGSSGGRVVYSGPAGSELGWVSFCRGDCDSSDTGAYQLTFVSNLDGAARFSDSAHRIDFYSRSLRIEIVQ